MAAELDAMEERERDLTAREAEDIQSRSASPAAAAVTTPKPKPLKTYYYLQEGVHRIYKEYKASREAWFNQQLPGTSLTDRDYREAAGLPLEYDAAWYRWCRQEDQMGPFVKLHNSFEDRKWTKEEMHSWLDNSDRDDDVAAQLEMQLLEAEGPGYVARQGPAIEVLSRLRGEAI
ncbi:hypothetical protein Forpi1262_v008512 [Fusarium oxysporum f. sp. raphani]|uniref:Uncharacterized protein n=1 Tax=Fusarium oxysporum f. sp. raphani TaxID=96318 RepID=A0A8J5NJX5_FUSOX|nr:hypothetical protein Forpi1262_v018501 [Fusarium oxysporum f. sp. raphani]KAG7429390.1 hypothetical protein Forpi1262_v009439 [Fusarium oxysporum f. sp. raphani]KAG7430032.1 hypothetical protein Forpi1262_v008512 [Fusarium oxysporum f. sp. raphani]